MDTKLLTNLFEGEILMELETHVRQWLAKHFDTEEEQIEQMLKTELATTYLLIWPIMEQGLFGGFMQKAKIKDVAAKFEQYYSEIDTKEAAKHFHTRYQDKNHYRNLKHYDEYPSVDETIKKQFDETNCHERLELLLYVVYRYRNNIFHGNKGIESWCSAANSSSNLTAHSASN